MSAVELILAGVGGGLVTQGGQMVIARGSNKTARVKADGEHETAARSVALEELEAVCRQLADVNRELRVEMREMRDEGSARDARIDELVLENVARRDSEQDCRIALARLEGQIEVLRNSTQVVTVSTAPQPAATAAPTEG